MKYCDHSHWLSLHKRDSEITFTHSDRAESLLQSLPHAESQRPSLFVLIGNNRKSLALRELVSRPPRGKLTVKRGHGEIHLHIASSTVFGDRPLLFAEGDFPSHDKPSKVLSVEKCHEATSTLLPRLGETTPTLSLQKAADDLYFQLLSPLTDAFCFFAADLGGLLNIARRLASWLDSDKPSTPPLNTHPQIIIVIESSSPELQESRFLERFMRLLNEETERNILDQFAGVRILSLLPDSDVSTQARHRRLKECLMNASDYVRSERISSRTLFSAVHLAAFLNRACSHFSEGLRQPFDFIQTSRLDNPPAPDLKEHLTNFLSKIKTPQKLTGFAIPLIASSFLLDHYTPDMHRFSPSDVFRALYKDICYETCRDGVFAHENSTHLVLPSGFVQMIEDTLSGLFDDLNRYTTNTSVDLHRQLLLKSSLDCLSIHSDDTCFICLRRRPQYRLPCRHCICDNCVRVFGRRNEHDPWVFEVDSCFFCGLSTDGVVVKTLPKTAGIRLLTLDGGGVRGLATLEPLQALQDEIGLPYPVQENFDVVYGTSIGGIIGLALSVNGWSVEQCSEYIERLAGSTFQPRPSLRIPILSPAFHFLLSYFADCRYSADNLEAALRDAFGDKKILDCSRATATGTRFGLPVTTIRDTATCVFTNYNGVGTRPRSCGKILVPMSGYLFTLEGYHILRPKDGLGLVPLWEIARCGSAAPSYFKPKYISGVGTFQDGGLRHNDPGNLALQEVAAMYPFADEPSLVVSLGTGSRRPDEVPRMSASRGFLRDGFIPRLFRAFMLSMSSTGGHKFRSRQREGRKEQYFRFDIEFEGHEPQLDDTTKMPELKAAARSAILGSKELNRLARCIIASLFVFELDYRPEKGENGAYNCTGYIICRLRSNSAALGVLLDLLMKPSSGAKFLLQDRPLSGSKIDRSYLDIDGNFRKCISFSMPDKRSQISICLQEAFSQPCSISGSPYSINSLVAAQELDAYFGTGDHVKRKRVKSTLTLSRKRRRV